MHFLSYGEIFLCFVYEKSLSSPKLRATNLGEFENNNRKPQFFLPKKTDVTANDRPFDFHKEILITNVPW